MHESDKGQKWKSYLQRMQLQKDGGSILMISLMVKWIKANKQQFSSQLSHLWKNQEATRTPRNNKAPGVDNVPYELLRTGGDKTLKTNLC